MKCSNPFAFRPGPVSFWTTAIYLAVAVPVIWVHETVPPAPEDHSLYRGLNLSEAWLDLQAISSSFHPFNSHDNDLVRDFLVNRSREILDRSGLDYTTEQGSGVMWHELLNSATEGDAEEILSSGNKPPGATLFDDQTSNVTWTFDTTGALGSTIGEGFWSGQYFEGNNFYVYIHGKEDPEGDWWRSQSEYEKTHGKGGVLVNCHLDSVSTAYGATDDGVGCVSMLQLLSYFTSSGRQPRNGIVLLFNNAEEDGLLGARAFGNSPLLSFCHTFLNLEGAGAGGRALLFRTTDLEAAKAYSDSPHPFGTVVAADAFKAGLVKSGTDFTAFTEYYGQRGVDVAFYEPRARYHTDEDDARHTSISSIWHMLSAAVATTERLSDTTGTVFNGPRSDGDNDLVQNGKRTDGVWFDLYGSAWASFALRGLFAWSLTLLVATPLVLLVITAVLVSQDKYYYFTTDVKIHSELNDDPVNIGGWKGFFRFPLAFIFAGGLTIASVFLVAKFNPLIVYSSSYAVWAMTLSLFYFVFWLIMRGSSFVRPSALQRGFVNMWLFTLGWAVQVVAAVAEDRLDVGAFYFAAFLQTGVFAALAISLLEQFALPAKRDFATQLHDAHQARDHGENRGESAVSDDESHDHESGNGNSHEDEGDDDESSPTETTPLRSGEQNYGSNDQPTFASTYRQRSESTSQPSPPKLRRYSPYDHEQSWSGRLPTWTWIIQFLLLAPVPVLLIGNLGLVATSTLRMTGTDGGSDLTPVMTTGLMSIILLLPLTPFIHRVTHHVPTVVLLVFIASLIYNLAAFPFSTDYRFKFFFQQMIDLDEGTNLVTLTGIEEYIRPVIEALPITAGQTIHCAPTVGRDLADCSYDASPQSPKLADGKKPEELMNVTIQRSSNGATASVLINALNTRTCYLDLSDPIYGFSVEGGGERDPRFGSFPPNGLEHLQVWRRDWEKPWNVTLELTKNGKAASESSERAGEPTDEVESFDSDELKARSGPSIDVARRDEPSEVTVRCAWSDANKPSTIPALHELEKYMPTWAIASKVRIGLVEVKKTYEVPA